MISAAEGVSFNVTANVTGYPEHESSEISVNLSNPIPGESQRKVIVSLLAGELVIVPLVISQA
ncbi:hypothetical protein JYT36_00305 [Bacteroidales bacterium AH-315-N07]|nr:hypothetical protein [Bacteroidales bacterium AH-315-N07]